MLLIDKPVGISSFGVVAAVRRVTGVKKVGHAGTLDPLATGLVLVMVGKEETKLACEFTGLNKSYEAVVRIGESRTTGDLEGDIVTCDTNMDVITHETVKTALKTMVGTIRLPVPAYSAMKQGGQRLYKKARKKQRFVLPVRDMTVHKAKLLELKEVVLWDSPENCRRGYEAKVLFDVESGVYIRSLSEEFGKRLNCHATTAKLRRISIGMYGINNAQALKDIKDSTELIHYQIGV